MSGLPAGSDYAAGHFRKTALGEFLFYKPGQNAVTVRPLEKAAGQLQLGKGESFDLGQPIRRIVTLNRTARQELFVIFGQGEKAGVFEFDGVKAPSLATAIAATNELFTSAASLPEGFVAFTQPTSGKFSTKYRVYKARRRRFRGGRLWRPAFPGGQRQHHHSRHCFTDYSDKAPAIQESDMKPYTNTIPGTRVAYAMVPIHGGEFVMGSPESRTGRKPDEGPQHKVKISPFWMEQI